MDQRRREQAGLFRLSVIGPAVYGKLRRGQLRPLLKALAERTYRAPDGRPARFHWRTLEDWFYAYRKDGFRALVPKTRCDAGQIRCVPETTVALIQDMKREDPGRSAPMILRELELAGQIRPGSVSPSTIRRILRHAGLSGPKLELVRPARYRWRASRSNAIWQADALHGPPLIDPESGRRQKTIIFGLLDDRSRLGVRAWADFRETEAAFLHVLYEAMVRRGIPDAILLDNHRSFRGHGLHLVCAHLHIRLIYARPKDGPGKGAIERLWRTLRAQVLDRLDPDRVRTVDDLNLRLVTWLEHEYNLRPHAGLAGHCPMEVWKQDLDHVRWVQDHAALEALFVGCETRKALNDSTISFRGTTYEVPTHLRRRKVQVRYSLLNPDRVWVLDGDVEVPLRPVNPERNATRLRRPTKAEQAPTPSTGMNAVELLVDRICGRRPEESRHA